MFRGFRISPPPSTVASWGSDRTIVSIWCPLRFSQKGQWKPRTKPLRHEEEASSQRLRAGGLARPEGKLASSPNFISHRILCVLAPLCEPGSSPLILLIAGSPSDPSASRFAAAAAGGPVLRSRWRSMHHHPFVLFVSFVVTKPFHRFHLASIAFLCGNLRNLRIIPTSYLTQPKRNLHSPASPHPPYHGRSPMLASVPSSASLRPFSPEFHGSSRLG